VTARWNRVRRIPSRSWRRRGEIFSAPALAIWDEVAGQDYVQAVEKPLTLAADESGAVLRAPVEPVAVGNSLIETPLYLEPGRYVAVPFEETYQNAFDGVPRRWRIVLEPG
jgi:hypothetical protein